MTNYFTGKKCFIITPIGSTESEIRRATEGLIEAVIIPSLEELGFSKENISVAHRISESGSINRQIIKKIIEDDLAIVNLTGLNPNVMYELAVRHAIARPVVMLAEDGTRLPFDIVDQRTIFYKNDMLGAVQLKEDLKTFVQSALNDTQVENPLIQLIQENNALNNINGIDKGAAELILDRLDRLERKNTISNNNMNKDVLIDFEYNKEIDADEARKILYERIRKSQLNDYLHEYKVFSNVANPYLRLKGVLKFPLKARSLRQILIESIIDENDIIEIREIDII